MTLIIGQVAGVVSSGVVRGIRLAERRRGRRFGIDRFSAFGTLRLLSLATPLLVFDMLLGQNIAVAQLLAGGGLFDGW